MWINFYLGPAKGTNCIILIFSLPAPLEAVKKFGAVFPKFQNTSAIFLSARSQATEIKPHFISQFPSKIVTWLGGDVRNK